MTIKRSKSYGLIKFTLIFLFIILLAASFNQWHRIKGIQEIDPFMKSELTKLALNALQSHDVPVAAICLYRDSVIGKGWNTVMRDKNLSGHAEINALNDAVSKIGYDKFMKLDRNQLFLISTFEPCEMCKGTLNHYRVRNVSFLKDKSWMHWIKVYAKELRYELRKTQIEGESIQDSLFYLHPDYPLSK